jgi:hypothetical protein
MQARGDCRRDRGVPNFDRTVWDIDVRPSISTAQFPPRGDCTHTGVRMPHRFTPHLAF